MKQYICLNHGECNWADETPPREFSLPEGDDQVCPNCESTNIKEKPKPSKPPWLKIAGILGIILLIAAFLWAFWPVSPPLNPLILNATPDCQQGIITLTTNGGDGSSVIFGAEGLKTTGDSSVFQIPEDRRNGSTFTFFAIQNEERAEVQCKTDCKIIPPQLPGDSDTVPKRPVTIVKWTRVAGSNFCEPGTCTLIYAEIDNLGHTRERRTVNYAPCCPAEK